MRASRVGAALAAGLLLGALGSPALAAPGDTKPGDKPGTKPGSTATQPGQDKPDKPTAADCTKDEVFVGGKCKPAPDTEAPATPAVGEPLVEPEGKVTVPVVAEAKSRIEITEDGSVVRQARATGVSQNLTFQTVSGKHTYAITATDKAGNVSDPAPLEVDVDATPPRIKKFTVKPGTSKDTESSVSFVTEPKITWTVDVDGKQVKAGTTPAGARKPVEIPLDLADGRHPVAVHLEDETGNTTDADKTLAVRIPDLSVQAELTSESTDTTQLVAVTATPGAAGVLRIPGQDPRRFVLGRDGTAQVALDLTDGTYQGPTVTVRDDHGRSGSTLMSEIVVDTTPPVLDVVPDEQTARDGKLAVTITADDGSTVEWKVFDATDTEIDAGKYVSTGAEQTVASDLEKGAYTFTVTATDVFDRATDKSVDLTIAADPLSPRTIVLGALGLLLLLLALVAIAVRLWRRRREKVKERQATRPVKVTKEVVAAYERAEAAWAVRHRALSRLEAVARGEVPHDIAVPDGFRLLPDELVLWRAGARLLSVAESGGEEVALETGPGELVVTTQRLGFVGPEQRDWWFSMVERVRHLDHERTILRLSDTVGWTGLVYDDPELTQQYIDLAVAGALGGQEEYLAVVTRGLRDHEMRRPTRPA
jgi:hypothetical protein